MLKNLPQLGLSLTFVFASLVIYSTYVHSLPDSPQPKRPPRGTPTPGGTLGGSLQCPQTPKLPNLLIPDVVLGSFSEGQGSTTSLYPTFWVYIPYTSNDIKSVKFSLLKETGYSQYPEAEIRLSNVPGVVGITLPPQEKYALEEGKFYKWNLNIYCSSKKDAQPKSMDGWVQRVGKTSGVERSQAIWYDAVTNLAKLRLKNDNATLKAEWEKLMSAAVKQKIAEEKLIEIIVLPDK